MKQITLYLFVAFIILSYPVKAEKTPYFFSRLGVENGLSQSTVLALFQDSDGYIWMGTQGGLNRYDGYQFKIFKNNPHDSTSLVDNNILSITEDKDKNIWVVTDNGLHKIAYQTETLKRYTVAETRHMHVCWKSPTGTLYLAGKKYIYEYDPVTDQPIFKDWLSKINIHSNIRGIQEDKAGNLYIATSTSGLVVLDKNKRVIHHFKHNPNDPSSFIQGQVTHLFIDSQDQLWVTSDKAGICLYDKTHHSFIHLNKENSKLSSNVVRSLIEVRPGKLLAGTFAGLNEIDKSTLQVSPIPFDPDKAGALSHYSIQSLLRDKAGSLWVGTWKGLNYYNPLKKQMYMVAPKEFTGILGMGKEDTEGNIWFATEGAGLFCYHPKQQSQELYPIHSPFKKHYNQNIIKSLYIRGDSILCATNQGVVYLFSRSKKTFKLLYDYQRGDIYNLLIDSKNRLWIPTNSNVGLVMIENGRETNTFPIKGKKQKINFVTTLKELSPDRFLFGTLNQGLYLYNRIDSTLQIITSSEMDLPEDSKLGPITSLLTDSDGNIWISAFGSGIFKFDPKMNLIKRYTEKEGVSDRYIYTLVYDSSQTLWALAGTCLYHLNPTDGMFSAIRNTDIQPQEFTLYSGTVSRNGFLYFPGNKGILCFNPNQITNNPHVPPVYLTSLTINGEEIKHRFTEPLVLNADQTNITIQYTALDYTSSLQNQYAFWMEGVDKDWIQVNNRRTAYYNNLAPGHYTFHVKAANNDGLWNPKEAALLITVKPPLYKTWWAYLLYISLLSLIIGKFVYHQKVRHELESSIRFKQMEQEKENELHEERMRLFTNFSHELRTPLTLIINPLEDLLQRSAFSTEVKNTLQLMRKNTQRLLLLVNNLMDVQKYDSQKVVLQKEKFNLAEFIDELYELFVPVAHNRQITFTNENTVPPHWNVYYDRTELEKVLFNLLSNAFKFTPEQGSVAIRLATEKKENLLPAIQTQYRSMLIEDYYLHIEIKDSGTGIETNELDKIFQPFYRSTQDLHHQIAGSGIGLSLARFIVEQHNGIIWAENVEPSGTAMHVMLPLTEKPLSLPLRQSEKKAILPTEVFMVDENKQISPALSETLLLVEDNDEVLEYLEKQFEKEYHIQKAGNGMEALRQMEHKVPDLIISDVMMPEMDGLALCKQVKAHASWSHIPVILLTAKTMPNQITEGFQAGADEYIVKPFDIALLRMRVKNLLTSRKQIQKKFEKKLDFEALGIQTTSLDEAFMKQYTAVIKANFSNPELDVDLICKTIGMSRAKFYRKAKESTSMSPAEMIKCLRLEAAAQLLRESDLSISEILEKVAFSSSGYFASCFKNKYGMSPKEYRKENTTSDISQ